MEEFKIEKTQTETMLKLKVSYKDTKFLNSAYFLSAVFSISLALLAFICAMTGLEIAESFKVRNMMFSKNDIR